MSDRFYGHALYDCYQLSDRSFLYENLNEGLIKSYDIDDVQRWLNNDLNFDCVQSVNVLRHNTYESKKKALSDNEFVEITLKNEPKSLLSYEEVIQSCYCLLGWFTGIINVKLNDGKGNYIPYIFYRGEPYRRQSQHDFLNCFFSEQTRYELRRFLQANIYNVYSMSLIIEEKFPIKRFNYYDDVFFYHKTRKNILQKILKNGLIPKSNFNYPSRIYLTNNIEDLDDTDLGIDDYTILKIRLTRNQVLYKDPRSAGFFTYDNISPDEIEVL